MLRKATALPQAFKVQAMRSQSKKHGLSLEKPQLTKKTKNVVHAPEKSFFNALVFHFVEFCTKGSFF